MDEYRKKIVDDESSIKISQFRLKLEMSKMLRNCKSKYIIFMESFDLFMALVVFYISL